MPIYFTDNAPRYMSTLMMSSKILWFYIGALKVSGRTSSCSGRRSAWSLCGYHEFGNLSWHLLSLKLTRKWCHEIWPVFFLGILQSDFGCLNIKRNKIQKRPWVCSEGTRCSWSWPFFSSPRCSVFEAAWYSTRSIGWSKNYTKRIGWSPRIPRFLTFSWGGSLLTFTFLS